MTTVDLMPLGVTPPPIPRGMEMAAADDPRWAALRARFPASQIEMKPQPVESRNQGDPPLPRGRCARGSEWTVDGKVCGGYHSKSVHLDYVGHAGLTLRLLDVVGPVNWEWRPMVWTDLGTPRFTDEGMWIWLTILGLSKPGYGSADGKRGPNAIKETIGDAMRNAALRFGIATYLWSKSADAKVVQAVGDVQEQEDSRRSQQRQERPQGRQQQRGGQRRRGENWTPPQGQEDRPEPSPLDVARGRAWEAVTALLPEWTVTERQQETEARLATRERTPTTATVEDWDWVASTYEEERASNVQVREQQEAAAQEAPADEDATGPEEAPRNDAESAPQP